MASSIKIPKPHSYSGKGEDRSLSALKGWKHRVESFIEASEHTIQDKGLLIASSYLSGIALT